MIVIVLFCIFVAFLSYIFFKRDGDYLKIPGPPSYPLVGASLTFLGKSPTEIFDLIISLSKKYGPTWRNDIGFSSLYVFLDDPKDLEVLLSSQKLINKGTDYGFLKVSFQFDRNALNSLNYTLRIGSVMDFYYHLARSGTLEERSSPLHSILKFWSNFAKFFTGKAMF